MTPAGPKHGLVKGNTRCDAALDHYELARPARLLAFRRGLLLRLLASPGGRLTRNDARPNVPGPLKTRGKALGAVGKTLRAACIIAAGPRARSVCLEAHARSMCLWSLLDADAARRRLSMHPARQGEPPPKRKHPAGEGGASAAGGSGSVQDNKPSSMAPPALAGALFMGKGGKGGAS